MGNRSINKTYMKTGLNVLSFFDGMSCGRVALEKAGIKVDNYFACEIDKFAITVAQKNYPNTIQLGSVENVSYSDNSIKVVSNGIETIYPVSIDLIIGGSPCQGFSFCGKQLNFEDPRSKLFFEYSRVLNEIKSRNPAVKFFLENVRMKKESRDVISQILGVQPEDVNSSLVSAQERKRLYWTNIEGFTMPEDRSIYLEDILVDNSLVPVIRNMGNLIYKPLKSLCLCASYYKGADNHGQRTGCLQVGEAEIKGHDFLKRVYSPTHKSPTLTAVCGGNQERKIAVDASRWRKLLPIECERLQGLPDGYTEGVSNSQRYKMIGNGWQVDTIVEFFKHLK